MRLFRNGREIFTGEPQHLLIANGQQMSVAAGSFQLGESLPRGWYTLEISVSDETKRKRKSAAAQWVEFEVVE
jgi:hypothetical protein